MSWALASGTSLPPGLTLSSSGELSGTPSIAGSYQFTVVAVDSSLPEQDAAAAALSLSVSALYDTLAVSTATLPPGTAGTSYSQQLAATSGTTPYSWTVATGALPDGLTLSTDGLLSGTATASGSFTFTAQVTDSSLNPPVLEPSGSVSDPTPIPEVAQATFTLTIY